MKPEEVAIQVINSRLAHLEKDYEYFKQQSTLETINDLKLLKQNYEERLKENF